MTEPHFSIKSRRHENICGLVRCVARDFLTLDLLESISNIWNDWKKKGALFYNFGDDTEDEENESVDSPLDG